MIISQTFSNPTPDEAVRLVQENDPDFMKLFAARILANSSFPSKSLRVIFGKDLLRSLLSGITVSGRVKRRLELVEYILFDKPISGYPAWS